MCWGVCRHIVGEFEQTYWTATADSLQVMPRPASCVALALTVQQQLCDAL